VPVFADVNVAAGRDPGLAKALEILRKKERCIRSEIIRPFGADRQ